MGKIVITMDVDPWRVCCLCAAELVRQLDQVTESA